MLFGNYSSILIPHANYLPLPDMMERLDRLEAQSIFIFREAFRAVGRLAMLWSFGKDSNVMVHLARKSFLGRVPFPLIHCDTGLEFEEVYAFRDRYVTEWGISLISQRCPQIEATDPNLPSAARVAARKTLGLKEIMEKQNFTAIIAGIRRDEEAIRAKERVFSPRNDQGGWNVRHQPPELWNYFKTAAYPDESLRIHPLLDWTELDIWHYIKREHIAVVPLYFAKPYHLFEGREFGGQSMRFRSLGERGITWPVPSEAATLDQIIDELTRTRSSERAGRPMGADEDEAAFEKLRADGYM